MFSDSKYLFDTVEKLKSVAEKRFLIDIAKIRENYTLGAIFNVTNVKSEQNLAIVFTKDKADFSSLLSIIENRLLSHPIRQWIQSHKYKELNSLLCMRIQKWSDQKIT